jgi:hypothetical protein
MSTGRATVVGALFVAVCLAACGANGRSTAGSSTAPTASTSSDATTALAEVITPAEAPSTTAEPAPPPPAPATSSTTTPPAPPNTATRRAAPTTAPATTVAPGPSVGFTATVNPVTAADLGPSWHAGCPVGPASLRRLDVTFVGFDGADHTGRIVVSAAVIPTVTEVFRRLHAARFPIRSMLTIDRFGASDEASLAADNTAGFNCRLAVNPGGPPHWSAHAYGDAIDVNPVENPYVESNGVIDPQAGAAYLDRSNHRPGMAYPGSALTTAFAAAGWGWGGRWASPDYQHFSRTGG